MATINVKDASDATVAIEKPLAPGRAAAASSRPVALSTEDKAAVDALATQTTAAAILAKTPALGTAGTAAADVITVQGIASGVAQPVSGTVTANIGTVATLATAAKQPALGTAGSSSTDVISVQGIASGTALPTSQSGTWTVQPGNTANTTAWKVDGSAVTQPVSLASVPSHAVTNAGTFAVQAASTQSGTWTVQPGNTANTTPWLAKIHDGSNALTLLQNAADTNTWAVPVILHPDGVNANGQAVMASSAPVAIASNQTWPIGMSPRDIIVPFTTLTRPANTTAYTAGDSISDNATAGSVTALSATVSDTNDDPITLVDILVKSTDTGLAGKKLRAYVFNADPTASSGVGGGDNAAWSQKQNGYVGMFQGWMETGFSDGASGRLVPTFNETNYTPAGSFIVCKPTSGAKTLFIQYQAVEAFTPSANSTTIIGSARGFQGRAS